MTSTAKRRLLAFWLHWVLANATAFSTYVSFLGLIALLVRWFDPGSEVPLLFCGGVLGISGVGLAQQIVLRDTILKNGGWMFVLYAGLFVGFWFACAGVIPFTFFDQFFNSHFAEVGGPMWMFFLYGMGLGSVQTAVYSRSYRHHFAWILASGLGVVAVLGSVVLTLSRRRDPDFGDVLIASTFAGAAYGMITGGCLVWLLHTAIIPPRVKSPSFEFLNDAPKDC